MDIREERQRRARAALDLGRRTFGGDVLGGNRPERFLFLTVSGAHIYGFPSLDSDLDLRGAHVLPLVSVPVVHEGPLASQAGLEALVGPSTCKTAGWREVLTCLAADLGLDPGRVRRETDPSDLMPGRAVGLVRLATAFPGLGKALRLARRWQVCCPGI